MNGLTEKIIGAAIEVHKALGPGLLESVYEQCLAHELSLANISFERQVSLPVSYKSVAVDCGYRLDFLVERTAVLELKAVEVLHSIYEAQLLTYLKLGGWPIGVTSEGTACRAPTLSVPWLHSATSVSRR